MSRANLTEYPNLQSVLDGRVDGNHTDWPMIRVELAKLLTTRADGYREGMVAAAEIADQITGTFKLDIDAETTLAAIAQQAITKVKCDIAAAILAAASEPAKVPEVCVWEIAMSGNRGSSSCGEHGVFDDRAKFCPYCGKAISVREG